MTENFKEKPKTVLIQKISSSSTHFFVSSFHVFHILLPSFKPVTKQNIIESHPSQEYHFSNVKSEKNKQYEPISALKPRKKNTFGPLFNTVTKFNRHTWKTRGAPIRQPDAELKVEA